MTTDIDLDKVRTVWRRAPRTARPLPLSGIPREYWREEVRLGCAASLARLRALCAERGADYEMTLEVLLYLPR